MLELGADVGRGPEPECGDNLTALGTVEQVERDDSSGDCADQSEQFAETQIEASFCEAIRIAREQKSISLGKRAEGTYAEYRRQKANASGGRGFRLPL
ncbi:hypothetical protein B4Q13_20910, partial [Lacticaseibacillus rhamnosus]